MFGASRLRGSSTEDPDEVPWGSSRALQIHGRCPPLRKRRRQTIRPPSEQLSRAGHRREISASSSGQLGPWLKRARRWWRPRLVDFGRAGSWTDGLDAELAELAQNVDGTLPVFREIAHILLEGQPEADRRAPSFDASTPSRPKNLIRRCAHEGAHSTRLIPVDPAKMTCGWYPTDSASAGHVVRGRPRCSGPPHQNRDRTEESSISFAAGVENLAAFADCRCRSRRGSRASFT